MAPNVGSNALDTTAPAFISYCRQDAEIALRLAKDLKAGGASVWLDQLDIAPGQRWDRAVEQALIGCRRMVIVLTPASVESTNVMDEVSFALEEQKTVIPVVHQECAIPFRLRRLQRVELKLGYDQGLRELLRVLLSSEQTALPVVAAAVPPVSVLPVEPPAAPMPLQTIASVAAEARSNPQPLSDSVDMKRLTKTISSKDDGKVEEPGERLTDRFGAGSPWLRAAIAGVLGAFGGLAAFGPWVHFVFLVSNRPIFCVPSIVIGVLVGLIQVFRSDVQRVRAVMAAVLCGVGWLIGDMIAILLLWDGTSAVGLFRLFVWGLLNVVPVFGALAALGLVGLRPFWLSAPIVLTGFANLVFHDVTPSSLMWSGAVYLAVAMASIGLVTAPAAAWGK